MDLISRVIIKLNVSRNCTDYNKDIILGQRKGIKTLNHPEPAIQMGKMNGILCSFLYTCCRSFFLIFTESKYRVYVIEEHTHQNAAELTKKGPLGTYKDIQRNTVYH